MSQQFLYKAMDNRGRIQQGQLDAHNASDLEARLERMGLDLIYFQVKKTRHFYSRKITRPDLITFTFHMEQLTRAGVPLLEGLNDLRDSLGQTRFREIVSNIIDNIEGGECLSDAMKHFPEAFDAVFVSLVRAGEESGNLSLVFKHLTESLKWQDELAAKTKKLLTYPAFVFTVIIGVLFFLMIYLVPQMISFIKGMGGELPLHTKILLSVSNFFVSFWYVVLGAPILAFILLKMAMKMSFKVRFNVDRIKLKIWIMGPILEKIILARFTNFFALLYGSGITVLEGLHISKGLAGNLVIEAAIQKVIDSIQEGTSIGDSFDQVRFFPPLVLRMVRIGEMTGELEAALNNVSYFYNREIKDSIEKIQTLIEPIMTVLLGAMLGWVMISVLGPIYDIISKFKYR
jgi:type IV pilus assembly protein PilC